MERAYVDVVRLLLDSMPDIFVAPIFAMKGGTAINLFVQDMPRLSVDIDVVYTAHRTDRTRAIAEIQLELVAAGERLRAHGIDAEMPTTLAGDETKMIVRRGRQQVKVEVNHVLRGTVMPLEMRSIAKAARDLCTTAVTAPTLATPELYGSKLVAALDRQHPRDWFDVHGMYRTSGLSPAIVDCFVSYLAGHSRPVHEVLFSNDVDMTAAFEGEFVGMEVDAMTLEQLQETRAALRADLKTALTDKHQRFLLGLVLCKPDWGLMACGHLSELPAVQWKLQNLNRLTLSNSKKFALQQTELEQRFLR